MRRYGTLGLVASIVVAIVAFGADTGTSLGQGVPSPHAPLVIDRTGPSVEVQQVAGGVVHPLFIKVHRTGSRGNPLVTSTTPYGYTPTQIQGYLGLSGDGSGQTIAIVDAYDDPNVAADLNQFSTQFGLPLICGSSGANPANCFTFQKATPQGVPTVNSGWALEISLDVQWAHAVAPKATILLVEAKTSSLSNLLSAIDYAAQQPHVVAISNSWGASEFSSETAYDSHCSLSTAVCTFASGDSGNPGLWPAYGGEGVAVGGTSLTLDQNGALQGETAWSGSGGGISKYEAKPSYQSSINASKRGIPDVSYNADPATGVAVYDSVSYSGQSGWFQVGGTSAGAPQWAAIIAVVDQLRGSSGPLSSKSLQASTSIYGLTSGLADIVSGKNGSCGSVCTAATGYDFVTGLGSPRSGIDTALSSGSGGGGGTQATAPVVSSTSPANGATNVSTGTSITATFDQAMVGTSINGTTFKLTGPGNTSVSGTVSYNANTNTASFQPAASLASGTTFTATITTGATGSNGLSLSQNYVWTFTTAAAVAACSAPTITSHSDTSPNGGGTVTFAWSAVSGATRYTVQRQNSSGSWSTITTTSGTSYRGRDASSDPQWRVYVSSGTCSPLPGPATTFDP
jgi:subtilase family serine protease